MIYETYKELVEAQTNESLTGFAWLEIKKTSGQVRRFFIALYWRKNLELQFFNGRLIAIPAQLWDAWNERVTAVMRSQFGAIDVALTGAGVSAPKAVEVVLDFWVSKLGLALHPDTRGDQYVLENGQRWLDDQEARLYDEDMEALFGDRADAYGDGVAAWKRAGLLPDSDEPSDNDRILAHFPDYPIGSLPDVPAWLKATPWRNEACPSWAWTGMSTDVFLYIDYPEPAKREFSESKRFSTCLDSKTGSTGWFYTDDWAEVQRWLEMLRLVLEHQSLAPSS